MAGHSKRKPARKATKPRKPCSTLRKRSDDQREIDLVLVASRLAMRRTHVQITEELNASRPYKLTRQQISEDAAECRRRWALVRNADMETVAGEALEELEATRLNAWTTYLESRAPEIEAELRLLAYSDLEHYVLDQSTGKISLAEGAPKDAMRAVSSVKHRTRVIRSGKGDDATEELIHEAELRLWDKPAALARLQSGPGNLKALQILEENQDRRLRIMGLGLPAEKPAGEDEEAAAAEEITTGTEADQVFRDLARREIFERRDVLLPFRSRRLKS